MSPALGMQSLKSLDHQRSPCVPVWKRTLEFCDKFFHNVSLLSFFIVVVSGAER